MKNVHLQSLPTLDVLVKRNKELVENMAALGRGPGEVVYQNRLREIAKQDQSDPQVKGVGAGS